MTRFELTREPIEIGTLRERLQDPAAGGYSAFEGWVRNHNEGASVRHLEYEAFEPLAVKEGERILAEALERFAVEHAACVHRIGDLAIGDLAVWVAVSARHRHEAFLACRYIIDEVKHRLPIWKKEHYATGDSGWVNCERCASRDAPDHATVSPPVPDYSRQIALREVGAAGQERLRASSVLVVGCGGLGVPVLSYLAGAGIGTLGLVDGDRLEASNLHRQTLYALRDVGAFKAELAAQRLRDLNPHVDIRAVTVRLDAGNAAELMAPYDLVVDCTDNFATKFLLNDLGVALGKTVVFASVYQYEGQLQVVGAGGSCLRCIWPEATRDGLVGNCAEAGVLGPVPGTLGSLQALEVLKQLLALPGRLVDELLLLDLLTLNVSRVRAPRGESCPTHAIEGARLAISRHSDQNMGGPIGGAQTGTEIDFASLEAAVLAGFEVIDVREPDEAADAPLPVRAARVLPVARLLYEEPRFDPVGKCLLVCASGRRSLAATQALRSRGLDQVYSLRGGLAGLTARSV